MRQPLLAVNVIYHSKALKEPAAAMVTRHNADGTVNLIVFRDGTARGFSVFNVSQYDGTDQHHCWRLHE